jgi:prepilin-type N-terminal cleavage/methylation domain-containing protein
MTLATARPSNRGFTLIELLIVVGIIAILAAIALPNFLEAQVRAKVTRTRADLRTLATALEMYRVDNNVAPANLPNGDAPFTLTTPLAYITSIPRDVFRTDDPAGPQPLSYDNVRVYVDANTPNWPPTDLNRYGDWRFYSFGPQREDIPYIPYDPTNGTVSFGAILRTQVSSEGKIPFTFWDPSNPNI